MKIGIVGAGPAGLYFALLMKKHDPSHEIVIVDQSRADATYGWGVVFSGRALAFLKESNAQSYADIERQLRTWDDQTIIQKGEKVLIDGSGYAGIRRLALLLILQEHCRRHGVQLRYEQRLVDTSIFADYDLIVGADGANSIVRQQFAQYFQPSIGFLSNKYIWYGTHQLFDSLSLIFRSYRGGSYVAHCYPYSADTSTFIVECDKQSWEHAGFEQMSELESRAYCEAIFADDLQGHALQLNKSAWINFKIATNERWSYHNTVLLGDALRSIHFSIGSGTRMALEDAIALYHAFAGNTDVSSALQNFEQTRRPGADKLLTIAQQSYTWYETFHEKMTLDALPLAHSYMTRGGRIDDETLRQRAPHFMQQYDRYVEMKQH